MKEDFILPDIGEGIVECELVEWLVEEGDTVIEDQPVADVQTDKALVQIPAKHAGRVLKRYVEQGEIAKVHAPLFALEIADEAPVSTNKMDQKAQSETPEAAQPTAQPVMQNDYEEDFILPDIGEGIVECELVEWLVEEGDTVTEDQPVADVQTDKALVQIPAKHAGRVVKRYVEQGEIDPRTIVPLDEKTLVESAKKTGRVIVVDEGHQSFGVTSEIASRINEQAFYYLDAPTIRMGAMDVPIPFSPALEDITVPSPERVFEQAKKLVSGELIDAA